MPTKNTNQKPHQKTRPHHKYDTALLLIKDLFELYDDFPPLLVVVTNEWRMYLCKLVYGFVGDNTIGVRKK